MKQPDVFCSHLCKFIEFRYRTYVFFRTQRIMGRQWAKIRTVGEVGVVSHSHAELTDEGHMQHPKKVWF